MSALNQHGAHMAVSLIPLLLVLLPAVGVWPISVLHQPYPSAALA